MHTRFVKTTLAATLMMVLSAGAAFAEGEPVPPDADQGHGEIKFTGAIIDAPCSISQDSVDQTIAMGQVANSLLEQQGEGPLKPFEIKLESCAMETAKSATVTFNGIADDPSDNTHLSLNGSGKGAAIAMVSAIDGTAVVLGKPTKAQSLAAGDNALRFAAKVVSNLKTGEKATPGDYTASTNFVMSYQ